MFRSSSHQPPALATVELFQGVPAKELQRLENLAKPRHFEPGATVVREGDTSIALFAVTSGRVRVSQRGPDGAEREIREIGPGGAFGEMALFTDQLRSATIQAIEPTDCLALHRLDFLDELRKNPGIAIRLLETLSRRLIEAEHRT